MKYMIKSSYKNTYIKLNKTNIIRRKFIILGGHVMKVGSIYELEGKVPLKQAIPLGIQHVLAMFLGNVSPLIIVRTFRYSFRNKINVNSKFNVCGRCCNINSIISIL